MKILYVATERGAAESAARTLRGTAQNVTLTWTQTAAAALKWIQYNPDARAVIVDPDVQGPGCNALLEQVRHLGIDTPVAVIAPEHLGGLLLAFNEGRDAALADERERTGLFEARLAEIEEWRRQAQLRLAEERTGHDVALARTGRICTALQERLLELEAAERAADQRHAAQVATIERLAGREAELCAEAAEAMAARAAVEHQLAEAAAAERQSHQRAVEALAAAGERYADAENRLSVETAARTALEERLVAVENAGQLAEQTHATDLAALTARLAERDAQHDASSTRTNKICIGLQQRLLELEDAIRVADERHAVDLASAETARQHAATQHAAELTPLTARLADLESQCDAVTVEKTAFERQLRDTAAALEDSRRERIAEAAAASERLRLRESELGVVLSEAGATRAAVEATLAAAESAHHAELQRWQADLAGAAAARAAVERHLAEVQAEHEQAQASAGAALTAAVERHTLELARLNEEAEGLRHQLDVMRTHAAALRRDAERVPALQRRLEESQHENRRQFERAPYGLCECTRDGVVTRVNHTLARLLGYRTGEDLQRIGFDAAVFECADDLRLLLERAVETGKPQSVETLFKTRDSGRLNVRLHALSRDESIVIAVEDLTKLCAVEQRLREAHRMEAVGRVASEVAVTCDTLLRDVTLGGQRWLAGLESDTSLRHQGELLLDDVTRAADYLRQFVVYGNKAISNLEPVSVAGVLREMEPILKRVLGGGISLSLPKPARAFEVDVESETVQRIFVNVANYARERMTHGGRMKIDLATTLVDQRFLARHPEVRPGAHVLVRITESQGAIRGLLPLQFAIGRGRHAPFAAPTADNPGMDLGPLMAFVSDLGGHLWMAAEPGGNLTLEIRLPTRTTDAETTALSGAKESRGRGRHLARWFRS